VTSFYVDTVQNSEQIGVRQFGGKLWGHGCELCSTEELESFGYSFVADAMLSPKSIMLAGPKPVR